MSNVAVVNPAVELIFRLTCAGAFTAALVMKWLFLQRAGVAGEATAVKTYHSVSAAEGRPLFLLRSIWVVGWPVSVLLYAVQPGLINLFQLPITPGLRWFGVLLSFCGLGFMWWVHLSLGNNYGVELKVKAGHQLVHNGPYALVRHPMYLATLIVGSACALIAANLLLTAGAVIAAILYGARIDYEESRLLEAFGDHYAAYQCAVKRRLIPGIY